jgi:phosphoglycerate dehydrogenase-like enzyme
MSSALKLVAHSDRPEAFLDLLRERADLDIRVSTDYAGLPAVLEAFAPDILFSIKFAGTPGYPREAVLGTPSLRWVSVGGSGADHLGRWDPARLTVTNAAGAAAGVMAEYAMGAILHFSLQLPHFQAAQAAREWSPRSLSCLAGRTLAIIGLGRTGREVARLAKGFGMRVTGVRSGPRPTADVDRVAAPGEVASVFAGADYIVLCLPLTDASRGLVDRTVLAAAKREAVLIDISRGGVVDQSALGEALATGRLRGAALDVFEQEPLSPDSPLWGMPNVIVTPHSAGLYDGWERVAAAMFCDNLDRWRAGEPLHNVVDPGRGY